jgi:ABC-type polysaccharide/polyol phosphate export permease
MTFLCNTFFPLDRVPQAIRVLINLLPLTHASSQLRAIAYGQPVSLFSILVLLGYTLVFLALSIFFIGRRKNL